MERRKGDGESGRVDNDTDPESEGGIHSADRQDLWGQSQYSKKSDSGRDSQGLREEAEVRSSIERI